MSYVFVFFYRCAQPDVQIRCTEEQNRVAEGKCGRIIDPNGPFSVALQEGWVGTLKCLGFCFHSYCTNYSGGPCY